VVERNSIYLAASKNIVDTTPSFLRQRLYNAILNNCQDFCIRGLQKAGIPVPPSSAIPGGIIPDIYYRSWLLDMASRLSELPSPRVDTSYCFPGINCP
jgi:hypothetical protein